MLAARPQYARVGEWAGYRYGEKVYMGTGSYDLIRESAQTSLIQGIRDTGHKALMPCVTATSSLECACGNTRPHLTETACNCTELQRGSAVSATMWTYATAFGTTIARPS